MGKKNISLEQLNNLFNALSYDTISLDDVLQTVNEMNKQTILTQHKYPITYGKGDDRWHTYIPDDTKPNKRKSVAKRKKEDLEKFLVTFYKAQLDAQNEHAKTFKEIHALVQTTKLEYIKTEEKLISARNSALKTDSDYRRYFANTDFENKAINTITKKDLENICLMNLKRYDMRKKAFASLRGILKSVFDLAYSEYWIQDNIYQRINFKKFNDMMIRETSPEKRVHSAKEVDAILKELHQKQESRPKHSSYWALELQIIMGLRRGEVPPLRWIDVADNCISITREQLTSGNRFIIVEHTKNYKDRFFPITEDLKNFLIRLKAMHDKYYPDSEYLFPADTENGTITNRAVYFVYQGICEKLNIEKPKGTVKGPHSFRRNAITDVVNATNGNIILASALFGNTPEVAKQNYYTGINLDTAKEILNTRKLIVT